MPRRAKWLIGCCLLACLAASPRAASAESAETIVNHGSPANRVDIAILGDGYTAGEMEKYKADVQQLVQVFFAQEPYKEYQRYFNVHRVDVVSSQSGADHPERNAYVNTAFDAGFACNGIQRLVCVNTFKANTVLQNSLAPAEYDIKLVLVNDAEYGGSGGTFAVASTNFSSSEIVLHEIGHSFGLLADEYGGALCSAPSPGDNYPNINRLTDRTAIKWNYWIDDATPVPTATNAPGVPGLYQGGLYCDNIYYRPTYNSKMRTLYQPFEQINTEQLVKRIYNFVSPLAAASPAAASLQLTRGQTQTFDLTKPAPLTHDLGVAWFVDGQQKSAAPTFTLDTSALEPGAHTVEALVRDTTESVRRDTEQLLSETRKWDVTVTPSAQPTPTPYPAGQGPVLLTEDATTERAIALDSVTWMRDPFPVVTSSNFSADHRTRITLLASNVDLIAGENGSIVSAQAEDAQHHVFPLTVEYIGKVPGFDTLTQLVVKLPDELSNAGDVWLTIRMRGGTSNRTLITLASPPTNSP